ncbi:MAG: potassium-transporting ATPase subunit KdpC [Methanothrix sp.]|nr:potassium-transporting ATPase subunit KdpC [Methanothrix sp.]
MQKIAKEIKTAVLIFIAFSLLTGLIYPLLMTGIIQMAIPERASGSLVVMDGRIIGSELIGQNFSGPGYFHGRPSAVGHMANGSGGSNLGPTSSKLMEETQNRIESVRLENGLSSDIPVPADLVLASGSGLDPHISVEGAILQVPRIARSRDLPESKVMALVNQSIEPAILGIFGQDRVNVLRLNIGLDGLNKGG